MSDDSRLPQDVDHRLAAWLGDGPSTPATEPDAVLAALDALWAEGPPQAALEAARERLDAWWAGQQRPTEL